MILNSVINQNISKIKVLNIIINSIIESNELQFMNTLTQYELFSTLLQYSIRQYSNYNGERYIIIKNKKVNNQLIFQFICPSNNKTTHIDDETLKSSLEYILVKQKFIINLEKIINSTYVVIILFI